MRANSFAQTFETPRLFAAMYQAREQLQATSMDTTPKARRRRTRSDLAHLRFLPLTQPAT